MLPPTNFSPIKRFYWGKIEMVQGEQQIWFGDGLKGGGGTHAVRMREVEGSAAARRGEGWKRDDDDDEQRSGGKSMEESGG